MGAWPQLIEWLFDRARLAVQMFLVCGGFLTAGSLSHIMRLDAPLAAQWLWRRYLRLALPLLAALSLVVLVSEIIRPGFDHPSLSALPTWWQAWAHVFLLQHLLDLEALSAGVWYVAMDFQLYALALLVLAMAQWLSRLKPHTSAEVWCKRLWLTLAAASLWWWSGIESLDDYALYFCGSYAMGWLAYQTRRAQEAGKFGASLGVFVFLGAMALWLAPNWRLVTALAVAALLVGAPLTWFQSPVGGGLWCRTVQGISRMSYAVFVVHFGVSLAVNAWVSQRWPEQLLPNALGMLGSLALSLLAGALLFKYVEQPRPTFMRWLRWVGIFMFSVALAMHINSLAG